MLHAALMLVLLTTFALLIPGSDNFVQRALWDLAQRHPASAQSAAPSVAVIGIDEDTTARLGAWPWPSALHAALIEQLHGSGVAAIGLATPPVAANDRDTLNRVRSALGNHVAEIDAGQILKLREALDGAADGNDLLTQAIRSQGHVVLAMETSPRLNSDDQLAAELESVLADKHREVTTDMTARAPAARVVSMIDTSLLSAAADIGHVSQPLDSDGSTRREQSVLRIGTHLMPALSLALLEQSAGSEFTLRNDVLQPAPTLPSLPLLKDLSVRIGFTPADAGNAVPHYSYWQVITGQVPAAELHNRIVVVGFTDGANADRVATPVGLLPRVEVIAAATASLASGATYQHPVWAALVSWLVALALTLLIAWAYPRLTASRCTALGLGLSAMLLAVDFTMIRSHGVAFEWVALCTALLLTAFCSLPLRVLLKPRESRNRTARTSSNISMDTLKTLALTLHGQGQLDLAFETLRRCPGNVETLDLLYRLGNDFERRQQTQKAAQVFSYIAEQDANFKDAVARSRQYRQDIKPMKPAFRAADVARTPPPKPAAVADAPPRPGKEMLGRYEIEKQIGKGAMGVVYLGRDPKINRIVAIKAIPLAQEFDDSDLAEARERFFREAEMAGRLNYPGIVTIYDAGEDRGLAYIAMEYLHGEHLSYYADPKRLLPPLKALGIIQRVADALGYAHRQNVVHRDIKPANIMLNIDNDVLKITDFGIARLADVSRTKTGIVLGTPSFMSPEQLEGRPLDGRSDLFALGVTMYQLLTGQLPFRADSMTRLMNNIALEPHPPIRSLRPELPPSVEAIVDRALAKDAADRYQTGSEMAEAIRSCMRTIKP